MLEVFAPPWAQGRTLLTEQTKRWPEVQWRENEIHEGKLVLAHFSEVDQGRSRVLIAKCEEPHQAKLVVDTVNDLWEEVHSLRSAIRDLLDPPVRGTWQRNYVEAQQAAEKRARELIGED